MIVICDANIVYSSIITPDGINFHIIVNSKVQICAPIFMLNELKRHKKTIIELAKINEHEFQQRLKFLKTKIKFLEEDEIPKTHILKSLEITDSVDPNDFIYVALHLHTNHKIWTGDKKLIKGLRSKGYDFCITTQELKRKLKL
jgi:predicted nucleic acid-binding protein